MPSKSKKQQRFFQLVKAVQDGKVKRKDVTKGVMDAAGSMSKRQVSDFADHLSRRRKRVNDGIMCFDDFVASALCETHINNQYNSDIKNMTYIKRINEFINESNMPKMNGIDANTQAYFNRHNDIVKGVFRMTGIITNYAKYGNSTPVTNAKFNYLALVYSSELYWIYPIGTNGLVRDEDDNVIYIHIDDFCELVVSEKIVIRTKPSKRKLAELIDYYFSIQKKEWYINKIKDTDILDYLNPSPAADTYTTNGRIKISTYILDLLLPSQKISTEGQTKQSMLNTVPISCSSYSKINALGNYLGLGEIKNRDFIGFGNDGYNFVGYCGVRISKINSKWVVVKTDHAEYGTAIQNKVYDILSKALEFNISNINDLYITNHKDAQSSKCWRNEYLETAIKYLKSLIDIEVKDDHSFYNGTTCYKLIFNAKDEKVYRKWLEVFNFNSMNFKTEKQGNQISVIIRYRDFK